MAGILDVERPGAPPRLNVLVQIEGVDPDTNEPWEPEWLAISRLTTTLKRTAREMERDKYELSQVVSSQETVPLETWQTQAAVVIVRFLRRFYCLLLRVFRDHQWIWVQPYDLSTPERRRARACARLCESSARLVAALDGN